MIRKAKDTDLYELQQLFTDTIHHVCIHDYNDEQIRVWSSGIENKERWERVFKNQLVLVSTDHDRITGFCTLDKGHYIDFLFVHKDYLRKGIGSLLYTHMEQEAIKQNQKILTADVSKTAKPFFENMGFKVIQEQTVAVKGVDFINYKMKKNL
ncbi:hypothetical protein IQ37_05835 [Chryseobacterium piperi]|uniref:N-acetyltransferase domain-containing protein n=1 Tax=Chryseobacterium piperi TaxID=558152 RepID=A0A086BK55_9FLAO|nr:GNAT family N-acetyltransferase [Chryseobacterium piperi]ASW76099.1 GNAT family N-acetyltransferase [Chryseobacterium piperi]KFF29319.1 hypothetical protein IQ37_05835 [Chryseobacterium piperi]